MKDIIIESTMTSIVIVLFIPLFGFLIEYLIKMIVLLLGKYLGPKPALFIANRLTFLGTVHHELSHALFAFISGAKIVKIELFNPHGDSLGKVVLSPRGNKIMQAVQLSLSAVAPVIMGFLTTYLLIFRVLAICDKIWQFIIIIYVAFSIIIHSTMSKQDLISYAKGLPICSILILLANIIFNVINSALV